MTVTIPCHKATRGDGLHLVPSQKTERHQAEDPPKIWPTKRSSWEWSFYILLVAVCVAAAAWIAL